MSDPQGQNDQMTMQSCDRVANQERPVELVRLSPIKYQELNVRLIFLSREVGFWSEISRCGGGKVGSGLPDSIRGLVPEVRLPAQRRFAFSPSSGL